MKQTLVVIASLLAGFIGGLVGSRMAQVQRFDEVQVVRARRFELLNAQGHPISFWGIDRGSNAVLAFGDNTPPDLLRKRNASAPLPVDDPDGQRTSIGVIDDLGFLKLTGADGRTRVRMGLNLSGKPSLLMGDELGPRLLLGLVQSDTPGPQDNDWALDIGQGRAYIGMLSEEKRGVRYFRGLSIVDKERATDPYIQTKR